MNSDLLSYIVIWRPEWPLQGFDYPDTRVYC